MSRWDIQPESALTVIGNTAKIGSKLKGQADSYVNHVQSAAMNVGTLAGPCDPVAPGPAGDAGSAGAGLGLVGQALVAYANRAMADLEFMATRTKNTLEGAQDAIVAYDNGDLEMAERLEKAAIEGRDPEALLRGKK
ncbi:DUF6507 family protein [Streptomyces sp. NPDC049577]|uniref:DUF6507 family protein n=1 Tax=Streptomyces sp. NPDC049577 TaxID=3155153 RepID=UPI00344540CB